MSYLFYVLSLPINLYTWVKMLALAYSARTIFTINLWESERKNTLTSLMPFFAFG